jgi:hypothetical protein
MPLMSKKKHPFIIDENLSAAIKSYLPAGSRTTVECGMRKGTPDLPFVLDLCQREEAMLVTGRHRISEAHQEISAITQRLLLGIDAPTGRRDKTNRNSSETETGKDQAYPSPHSRFPF